MKNAKNLCILLFVIISILGYSQDTIQKKSYQTQKIVNSPIVIDGVMDDESWNLVEWGGDFIQQRPYEGKLPSQPTYFKILYDDNNLYVGVLNYDSVPGEIDRRMCRRDDFEGDFIEINIDSYNDQMTAFSFTLNAAGVRGDEAITEDGNNWDETWDPIWYGKTSMIDSGWVAEIKIPFTQLRFGKKANHSWGMQFT
ncbi:MAG: carbohydrate binding family 9 domain-containing protein, partial [Bacteroidales bacterium]|nr:carbohydrate binding family 9 domain-containing protein [Bacteroidales bacterium]